MKSLSSLIRAPQPVSWIRMRRRALAEALGVADLICFAASEAARYITSASFDINGGDLTM